MRKRKLLVTNAETMYENWVSYLTKTTTTGFSENLLCLYPEERAKSFEHMYVSIASFHFSKRAVNLHCILGGLSTICSTIGGPRIEHRAFHPGGLPGYLVYALLLLLLHKNVFDGVEDRKREVEEAIRSSRNQVWKICLALYEGLVQKWYHIDAQGHVFVPKVGMIPTSVDSLKNVVDAVERMFSSDEEMVKTCQALKSMEIFFT